MERKSRKGGSYDTLKLWSTSCQASCYWLCRALRPCMIACPRMTGADISIVYFAPFDDLKDAYAQRMTGMEKRTNCS